MNNNYFDEWACSILASPITKIHATPDEFKKIKGVIDARVFLKNTYGYVDWKVGQDVFERWEENSEGYKNSVKAYKNEIAYDRPIYEHFHMQGDILDVGGLTGTVREFLAHQEVRFISIDPFIEAPFRVPKSKKEAYKCLEKELNFIGGCAEFLPFLAKSFDYVHMRSMLDHVQVPDLALKEAHRVLKTAGILLVGLHVEGGKTGRKSFKIVLKDIVKSLLSLVGINKFKDFHTWHPSYDNLLKLIVDNGFVVEDVYWQPHWKDQVVYIKAKRIN
jgi:ubiquinone/menaquinone biosynthesis C-methylase UbiE